MTINLTKGEKLYLRRKAAEQNQTQASAHFRVSRSKYARWEHDELPDVPDINLTPTKLQLCIILRRRKKKGQQDIADSIGRCRYWVNKMETGKIPADELFKYWKL